MPKVPATQTSTTPKGNKLRQKRVNRKKPSFRHVWSENEFNWLLAYSLSGYKRCEIDLRLKRGQGKIFSRIQKHQNLLWRVSNDFKERVIIMKDFKNGAI